MALTLEEQAELDRLTGKKLPPKNGLTPEEQAELDQLLNEPDTIEEDLKQKFPSATIEQRLCN